MMITFLHHDETKFYDWYNGKYRTEFRDLDFISSIFLMKIME